MYKLTNFTQNVFENDEPKVYDDNRIDELEKNKLFPKRDGFGWTILRFLISMLFYLFHFITALIFIAFFASVVGFTITSVLDMAFEMVTPTASTQSKKSILSASLFFLLCSLLIVNLLILSLFWEILKVALFKTAIPYQVARVVFLIVVLLTSGIWVGVEKAQSNQVSLFEYAEYVLTMSWILAFAISILGSIVLLAFVFTQSAKDRKILVVHLMIALALTLFAIICPIAFGTVAKETSAATIAFAFLLPFLTAVFIIYAYFRGNRNGKKKSYILNKNISLVFLGILFLGIIVFTSIMNAPTGCTSNCKNEAMKNAEVVDKTPFSSSRYQICSKKWTSINLNIADFSFLANLTYHREAKNGNASAVQRLADDFFRNRSFSWVVKFISTSSPSYFHLQYKNVSVIAVKGSLTYKEFVESAKLWDESTVYQVLAAFVPILNQLPTKFISEYVSKASFINRVFHSGSNSFFFKEIEDYIKDFSKASNNTSEVILVGHSLGGGIAKIIGARLKMPAISFSSPGIAYSHVKLDFSLGDAAKYGVSISPLGDIIPLLDKHVGLQQKIECNGKTFVQCHLIGRTYCELHHGCGLKAEGCKAVLSN